MKLDFSEGWDINFPVIENPQTRMPTLATGKSGTGIRFIQKLPGHKSSRTTEIYTHVSTKNLKRIKLPFDDL